MSQCVPSWDNNQFTDASYNNHNHHHHHHPPAATKLVLSRNLDSNVPNSAPEVPMLDYEVAELTWENGQLGLHGLGQPQIPTWQDKQPGSSGTLESIVNQATCFFNPSFNDKPQSCFPAGDELVPWFNHRAPATSATMTIDALVPLCSNNNNKTYTNPAITSEDSNAAPDGGGGFTRVESCSAEMNSHAAKRHRRGLRQVPVVSQDRSTRSEYSANSSRIQFTVDTCTERDHGTAFTSTSTWSADNTSSGMPGTKLTGDDPDSICQSRSIMKDDGERHGENKKKGSSSGKRSRAAAIHNQSERKRRDKINQRMKTLQKLVPNSNKTDKASMLDEVIEYLKQLQAQVNMVNRVNMNMNMNMPQMMIPMTLNQQALQISMMGAAMANMPVIHPSAFMHLPPWDHSQAMIPDPMSAFLASQSQPVTMDSYRIMASMYQQQMQQAHQAPNSRT